MMVTGTQFYYYHVCERKLWLNEKQFDYEKQNDDVVIGKKLHELNELEEIKIDRIKVDEIDDEYITEKKKSKKEKKASIEQLKYYLYVFKTKGIERKGKIIFFEDNEEIIIELKEEDEEKIKKKEKKIKEIINNEQIPSVISGSKCKKCAYFEFCYL